MYELPQANYAVLKRILGHLERFALIYYFFVRSFFLTTVVLLCRITDFEEINQMYATNLAIVFGPTLVRAPIELGQVTSMMNLGKHNTLVKNLILQYHWIFDVEEDEEES